MARSVQDVVAAERGEEAPKVSLPGQAAGEASQEATASQDAARFFQNRSFSKSLAQAGGSRELAQGMPAAKPVDIQLSRWERFLVGEVLCPCCSFWLFLVFMLLMTVGGIAGGFKLSETAGTVLSSDIVQLYYAQKHLEEKGCTPGEVFSNPECNPMWTEEMDDSKAADSDKPRSVPGNAILIMYEATGTNCPGDECDAKSKNLLTERNMRAMKKFEDSLFGSKDFQDNYCLLRYPASGGAPVCNPPTSMLAQLYSDGPEVPESIEELFAAGFGNPLGECMCSITDEPCAVCSSPAVKGQALDCLMGKPEAFVFVPEDFRTSNDTARAYMSGVVDQLCSTAYAQNASCQFAAPFLSPVCSTTAWDHTKHGSAQPLQGEKLQGFLEEVCNPDNSLMSPLRRTTLPSFACQGDYLAKHGTPFLMSIWMMGHDGENQDKLESEYTNKLWKAYQEAGKQAASDTDGEMRPMMLTSFTALKSMESLLIHDCALAIGSFLVVFLYMWFTTESFFLSSMGMLQVVMSCPPAFLLWKFIMPDGVGFLQFLCVFMILGIGADDVFVLLDAWKQARVALGGHGTESQVFAVAYRRAFSAMLTTTATTGAAFLFGAFSPIPDVSQFCLFACIVVVFDFLWCISFFASSLRVYERFFMGRSFCCFGGPKPAGSCGGPGCCWGGLRALRATAAAAPCTRREGQPQGSEPDKAEGPALERFCAGPLFNFARRHKFWLLAFWLLMTATGGALAGALLKTATKPAEIGDDKNDVVRFIAVMRDYFTIQEQQLVQVSWGLPEESPVSEFTSTSPITPRVSLMSQGAERLTTAEGQQAALALCRSADSSGARCESDDCLVYGSPGQCTSDQTAYGNVSLPSDPYCTTGRYCFMEWVAEYTDATGAAFPVPQAEFVPLLLSDGFRGYLEERESANLQAGRHWDNTLEHRQTGWIVEDGELKFAWMTFNATFKAQGTKDVLNEWHSRWEGHVRAQAGASDPQQSSEMYVFMVLQNELLAAAIQGMVVSLSVTVIILALVTFNWVLALIGLLNISVITVIFLGVMPLIPWELGSNECIFLIAVVGLAVDYTVHLLHAYNEQDGTREEKMQGALSTMGISVASGAITTMGAGIMLFMCDIAFFQQYGSFIFLVILISLLAALTNLPPLILLLGPEGDQGKIAPLYWLAGKMASCRGTSAVADGAEKEPPAAVAEAAAQQQQQQQQQEVV